MTKFYQIELSEETVTYLKELYALITEKEVRNLLQMWLDGIIRKIQIDNELKAKLSQS